MRMAPGATACEGGPGRTSRPSALGEAEGWTTPSAASSIRSIAPGRSPALARAPASRGTGSISSAMLSAASTARLQGVARRRFPRRQPHLLVDIRRQLRDVRGIERRCGSGTAGRGSRRARRGTYRTCNDGSSARPHTTRQSTARGSALRSARASRPRGSGSARALRASAVSSAPVAFRLRDPRPIGRARGRAARFPRDAVPCSARSRSIIVDQQTQLFFEPIDRLQIDPRVTTAFANNSLLANLIRDSV